MTHPLFEKYGLKHLSISQIKTIKRSPFAWVCEKVLGRRGPPTEATTFGSFVHDNFERWLLAKEEEPTEVFVSEEAEGFYVEAWKEKAIRFWTEYRKQCMVWPNEDGVEVKFSTTLDDELPPIIGMIDVVSREDGVILVQDHKTVGAKRYAYATPEDLAKDPQLNLYAHVMMAGESSAIIQHNQLFKKIKRKPVNVLSAVVSKNEVSNAVEEIKNDGLEAIKILEQYDELGIEGFAHAVKDQYLETRWDFGGCPHWDFHQECLRIHLDSKHKMDYYSGIISIKEVTSTMPEDLHALVGKARDHFASQGLTKFDLADAVVGAVMSNLVDTGVRGVFIRDGEGGDLIYNQLLNQVAEKGILIFKKVG